MGKYMIIYICNQEKQIKKRGKRNENSFEY